MRIDPVPQLQWLPLHSLYIFEGSYRYQQAIVRREHVEPLLMKICFERGHG